MQSSLMNAVRRLKALRAPLVGISGRRLIRDERGTSTVTTAVTLPLLVVIMLGIFWLGMFMFGKWMLRQATNEAAQYISEQGRYWNINPNIAADQLPADWYDLQAYRQVANRLRDILPYNQDQISATLHVTVTEPLIATGVLSDTEEVCDPTARKPGDYRSFDETGFMVEASWAVPFWAIKLPYDYGGWNRTLTYHERAIGHIQCPRWTGREIQDISQWLGGQGPALPHREQPGVFPTISVPTVTAVPSPTGAATPTP
jgi:hypothetical protein